MRLAPWIIAALLALFLGLSLKRIDTLRDDSQRLERSLSVALADCQTWRDRDSLSHARVLSLELTLAEYERFRADDAELIKRLKQRNRDLAAVNKTQSQTIIDLSAIPRDTVVLVRDSIITPAVAVHCGDAWFDFDGILTADQFTGTLTNRDSLLLAETVKYRRFWGFLWKTHRIQDRRMDVVSRNPHTEIVDIEHIIIDW